MPTMLITGRHGKTNNAYREALIRHQWRMAENAAAANASKGNRTPSAALRARLGLSGGQGRQQGRQTSTRNADGSVTHSLSLNAPPTQKRKKKAKF